MRRFYCLWVWAITLGSMVLVAPHTSFGRDLQKPLLEIRKENLSQKLSKLPIRESSARRIIVNVAQEVTSTGVALGINLFTQYIKKSVASYFEMEESLVSKAGDLLLAQFAASSITQSAVNLRNSFQQFGGNSSKMRTRALRVVHDELVQETKEEERIVGSLADDVFQQLKKLDEVIERELYASEPRPDILLTLVERRELILRSIPMGPLNIAHYDRDGDEEVRSSIDSEIKSLINEYPEDNRDTMLSLVQKMRDSSIFDDSERAQAYLFGPPGTGKTRFVRKLADALGLPLCEISFKDSSVEDILGKNYDTLQNPLEKKISVTGKLGRCFIEAGVTNPIIFFDEAGETLSKLGEPNQSVLLSFLKDLLDPEKKEIFFRAMGVRLDFSRATVIFAGNEELRDLALRSKLPSVHFALLGRSERVVAAHEALHKFLSKMEIVLDKDEIQKISHEYSLYENYLIEADLKVNPGARVLKSVIQDTLNLIRNRVLNHEPIEEEKIKRLIDQSISQRSQYVPQHQK